MMLQEQLKTIEAKTEEEIKAERNKQQDATNKDDLKQNEDEEEGKK